MSTPFRTRTEIIQDVGGFRFVWSGGPYVDVYRWSERDTEFFVTDLCINVWNYESGTARYSFSQKGLSFAIDDWATP